MSFWNYRVVRRRAVNGEAYLAIHEAFYSESQRDLDPSVAAPETITDRPVTVSGESKQEITAVLQMMSEAVDKPILDYENF